MTPDLFYGKIPEILIADDTLHSLRLLSKILSKAGYSVRSVNNGTLALQSARLAVPDMILLDIRMPDISGYEVCEQLKADPSTQAVPIIFISALNEPLDKVKAFQLGGIDFITKPIESQEVLVRIRSHLALYFSTLQIQKLNAELEVRVQQRTAELAASNQELRESELKFRQISEHIREVFWLTNYDPHTRQTTTVAYVSPAFESVWGISCAEIYARPLAWLEAIHPEDRQAANQARQKLSDKYEVEYRIIRSDGQVRWIYDRGFPIRNEAGEVYRLAGIAEDVTERRENQRIASLLAAVVESSSDAILTRDLEGRITSWNQGAEKLFGYSEADIMGQSIERLIPGDRHQEEAGLYEQLKQGRKIPHFETVRLHKNQHPIEVSLTVSPLKNQRGEIFGISEIVQDITQRKRAERERDRIFNLSLDLLFVANYDGTIKLVNPAWQVLLGYDNHELRDRNFWELIHPDDHHLAEKHRPTLRQGTKINALEIRCLCRDGNYLWTAWNVVPFSEEKLLYGAGRDISLRKQSEAQLIHESLHDALTGLANRNYFIQQLETVIKKESRHPKTSFAILFVDLDNFKQINDTLGHSMGDLFLIKIATFIREIVREIDTVARLGGDEFLILLEDFQNLEDVFRVARRLQENLQSSFFLGGQEVFSSASIGIVLSSSGVKDAATMIRNADIAMYHAKAMGKARYAVFDQDMYAETLRKVELENALRQAIARQELSLYYQPIVDIQEDLELLGFEILLRWHHPEKGLIPAFEFIPIAEQTGEINAIGKWVLAEACRQFSDFAQQYSEFEKLYFSINISGHQFQDKAFLADFTEILEAADSPRHRLKFEVTESSLIENPEETAKVLEHFYQQGIEIALDDFGTGFSSLRYLHQFAFNIIKIDKSFVQSFQNGARERGIIQSIIALARALDFRVIAEGIETVEQLHYLQSISCDYGQGYYFAKPMPESALHDYLKQKNIS